MNKQQFISFVRKEIQKQEKIESLKESIEKINKKLALLENDSFAGETSVLSDFKGREFSIEREEDGKLKFDFDSSGWMFDTNDVAEGVAIVCGSKKYKENEDVKNISITDADKQNVSPKDALYWLSGGNRAWRFGDDFNVGFDEVSVELEAEFGSKIHEMVNSSSNLGELIDKFDKLKDSMEIYYFLDDKGYTSKDEEEE